ncbi:MAG: FtsX-like permease family protein [Bacteriovoracaceae bacterium]|nr:FtsX-like permease family protein [Bacteriovoracaceae bacterium]
MIFKFSFRNIWRQRSRAFAVLATVSLGISALMIYHGFNAGIMNQYRDNTIRARFGHGQVNTKNYRDEIWDKPWERWIDPAAPFVEELKNRPEVEFIFPRISFYALLNNGEKTLSGAGEGVDGKSESQFFTTLNVIEGKILSGEEDGIILGKGLAEALKLKVGDRVTVLANTHSGSLNAVDVYVTGIFFAGMKSFDDTFFRIQLSKAQELLDTPKVENIALGLKQLEDWPKVESWVDGSTDYEATPFNVLDKVYYQNSVDFLQAQFGFIFIVIVVIVVLGIFNTVSTIILERKGEIGNMRANGDSYREVLTLLLTESLILGFIGATLGVLLSYFCNFTILANGIQMPPGPGITRQFTTFVELQLAFIPVCYLIGILSSLLGTAMAARRVLKMPITELLRG